MKKLLSILAAAALLLGLVSCGSTGGASKGGAPAAAFEHPMTYTLDIMDSEKSAGTIKFVDNSQYGTPKRSTRQNNDTSPEWTKLIKLNKPQVGDKIRVTGKFTSDKDIDKLYFNLVDNSAAAGYWCRITEAKEENQEPCIENIKAGEPVTIDYTFEVMTKVASNLILNMAYGEHNDGFATFTCERVAESDIGTPNGEVVDPQHKEPKTWDIDISKNAAFLEIKPNYPWINGVQDTMADPLDYSLTFSILGIFPSDDMPIKGDKLHLTWKTRCDIDISEIKVRAVENTAAVNWWKEIDTLWVTEGAGHVFGTDIKAGEVNNFVIDIELCEDIVEGISLCMWYELDAAEGSCTFMYVRDDE